MVVTTSSRVVGRESGLPWQKQFVRWGGNVGVLDLRQTPVGEFDTLTERFGVKTAYAQTDVSSAESLQAGFDQVMQTLGTLDGIFTAAGIAIDKPFR